jgi:hypothetical protein
MSEKQLGTKKSAPTFTSLVGVCFVFAADIRKVDDGRNLGGGGQA